MSTIRWGAGFFFLFLLLGWSNQRVGAQGFVTPFEQADVLPTLERQDIDIFISNDIAEITVRETYFNPHNRDIQGYYNYSLPSGAETYDLELTIKQAAFKGDVLKEEMANAVYLDAFRQRHEHGFLEMVGNELFRARMYPIFTRGRQAITLTYKQKLHQDNGLVRLVHPLRCSSGPEVATSSILSENQAYVSIESRLLPAGTSFTPIPATATRQNISVELSCDVAIKNVYSPSHDIEIDRRGEHSAQITYTGRQFENRKRFVLYYGLTNAEVGVDVLTHRVSTSEDGYFMVLLTPRTDIPGFKASKNLVYVLDASASMKGEKIKQVKSALRYCITSLNKDDYFNVIVFSTESRIFKKELVRASEFRQEAVEFINQIAAGGGTNINEALLTALNLKGGNGGPRRIVFVTDGRPTVGVTDVSAIRRNVRTLNRRGYSVHSFGLGYEIDTSLLDGLAYDNGGTSDYVEHAEEIETRIVDFYRSTKTPVVGSIELDFGEIDVHEMYPEGVYQLFEGVQLSLLGRYKGVGPTTLTVTCRGHNDQTLRLMVPITFESENSENAFLPRLWLSRRIGFLLEEIRFNEHAEAYRVTYETLSRKNAGFPGWSGYANILRSPMIEEAEKNSTGEKAVRESKLLRRLKEAEIVSPGSKRTIRYVGGKLFHWNNEGYWVESGVELDRKALNIKYGSDAYFALLNFYNEAALYLALGEKVYFRLYKSFIRIDEHGLDEISKTELREILSY
ncbi:MAG: VWA domain-containing protein [bacterium]